MDGDSKNCCASLVKRTDLMRKAIVLGTLYSGTDNEHLMKQNVIKRSKA